MLSIVTAKTYDQYCAVAKALDLVGERWTLLVVRELLSGPKRYTDLMDGIPGIATDMLAARLKTLEEAELVEKRTLPPPAASTIYELTSAGRRLEPVVRELAKFGYRFLGEPEGEAFRVQWLVLPLRMMFRPQEAIGPPLVVQFETDHGAMHVRIENGTMETTVGPAGAPDVVIHADKQTLAAIVGKREAEKEAMASGRLRTTGKKDNIKRALKALGLRE